MIKGRIKKIRERWWKLSPVKWLYLLAIIIFVYGVFSIRFGIEFRVETWVQIVLLFGLVLVTTLSMDEARRIRELTAKQVDEMREQRQSAFKPILLAKCDPLRVQADTRLGISLKNIGPGPALDIGLAMVEALPQQVEVAWETGKTSGITILGRFEPLESASEGEKCNSIPESIPFTFAIGREFLVVIECNDIYGNIIGCYRQFRLLRVERGEWKLEPTRTVTGRKINYRISSRLN